MRSPALALLFAAFAAMLAGTACAGIWGFEPLLEGPDGGDASTGGPDAAGADVHAGDDASGVTEGGGARDAGGGGKDSGGGQDAGSGKDGGPPPSGVTCENDDGMCSCSVMTDGMGGACSAAALGVDAGTVLCCADPLYPSSGSCTCEWIGCSTSGGVCICGPHNSAPGGSCPASSWTCCAQTGAPECLCASIACQTGFTPMGNACNISQIACASPQKAVDACN